MCTGMRINRICVCQCQTSDVLWIFQDGHRPIGVHKTMKFVCLWWDGWRLPVFCDLFLPWHFINKCSFQSQQMVKADQYVIKSVVIWHISHIGQHTIFSKFSPLSNHGDSTVVIKGDPTRIIAVGSRGLHWGVLKSTYVSNFMVVPRMIYGGCYILN